MRACLRCTPLRTSLHLLCRPFRISRFPLKSPMLRRWRMPRGRVQYFAGGSEVEVVAPWPVSQQGGSGVPSIPKRRSRNEWPHLVSHQDGCLLPPCPRRARLAGIAVGAIHLGEIVSRHLLQPIATQVPPPLGVPLRPLPRYSRSLPLLALCRITPPHGTRNKSANMRC